MKNALITVGIVGAILIGGNQLINLPTDKEFVLNGGIATLNKFEYQKGGYFVTDEVFIPDNATMLIIGLDRTKLPVGEKDTIEVIADVHYAGKVDSGYASFTTTGGDKYTRDGNLIPVTETARFLPFSKNSSVSLRIKANQDLQTRVYIKFI